jgi:hypothetical protein
VFENEIIIRMFSSERNKVMKECRKLHDEELKNNCNPLLIVSRLFFREECDR